MKGKERETARKTDSEQMRRRENKYGTKTLTGTQIKEGDVPCAIPSLSPLIIAHPSIKSALRFSSPCLCICLSLSSNIFPAPCWIRLKAEVLSIIALQTWFSSSVLAIVLGRKLVGSFGQAGHKCPYGTTNAVHLKHMRLENKHHLEFFFSFILHLLLSFSYIWESKNAHNSCTNNTQK